MHKRFMAPFCLAGCLMAWSGVSAQTVKQLEVQQHYKRAQEALQAKQDAIAAKEFREILRLDPRNASAHANLGLISFTQKNYIQAAEEFRAALKLRPALWNATAFLGMSEFRLGNHQEAKTLLEESFRHVQETKVRTQVGLDLVTLDYQAKDLDHAVDILRILEQAGSDEPAALYLAYRTYSDLAARQLAKLAQVAPESAHMHLVLAQALTNQGNYSGAIAQYRKALAIDPQLPGVHFELGQMILMNSADEPGRQLAEQEFKLELAAEPRNADCLYMLGEIEWLRSKPEEALKYYQQALALRPNFADASIAAGKALTGLGRAEEALKLLRQSIDADPQSEVAHYRLSQAYRKLGRMQDAEQEMTTFRKLRDAHAAVRSLYQQIQSLPQQTVEPNEP